MRAFRSLYFAVCVLVLSTGVGLYVDLKNHALQERHLAISTGLERMMRMRSAGLSASIIRDRRSVL